MQQLEAHVLSARHVNVCRRAGVDAGGQPVLAALKEFAQGGVCGAGGGGGGGGGVKKLLSLAPKPMSISDMNKMQIQLMQSKYSNIWVCLFYALYIYSLL